MFGGGGGGFGAARAEDAGKLQFGRDFEHTHQYMACSYNEVQALLEQRIRRTQQMEKLPPVQPDNQVFFKTQTHVDTFDKIKNGDARDAIRERLSREETGKGELLFHPFEVIQIMNLMPVDADEAYVIIPSLKDKPALEADNLNRILQEVHNLAA